MLRLFFTSGQFLRKFNLPQTFIKVFYKTATAKSKLATTYVKFSKGHKVKPILNAISVFGFKTVSKNKQVM